jgi:hypothetical protein
MTHKFLSPTLRRFISTSTSYLKNKKKYPILETIFHHYDYWKVLVYTLEAYEKKSPISKIDLIKKIDCSYKTANKYIDFLTKKQILICIKQNNINILKIRKIDFIDSFDKRYSYYIPSLNLMHELNSYLKQGY